MTPSADLLICLRLFSRVPVPETGRERALGAGGLSAAATMVPVAGLVLALPQLAVLDAALALRLPSDTAVWLALAASVLLTGGLHEDALADCADGFGGGRGREQKLAIMRDSRIGAYGAIAIVLSLGLRSAALVGAVAAQRGIAALLTAAVLSRLACLVPLALLRPARSDGAGASAADISPSRLLAACATAALITVGIAVSQHAVVGRLVDAALLAASSSLVVTALARRQIGGQTGDVAGAAQQVAEIAVLLTFAAGAT